MVELAMVMLKISNPIIVRTNDLPDHLQLSLGGRSSIGKHGLGLVEEEENVMKPGKRRQFNPINRILVDEARQKVKVGRARAVEDGRELSCDLSHLLTIPIGSGAIERRREEHLKTWPSQTETKQSLLHLAEDRVDHGIDGVGIWSTEQVVGDGSVDENGRFRTNLIKGGLKVLQRRTRDELRLLHGLPRGHVERGHVLGDITIT